MEGKFSRHGGGFFHCAGASLNTTPQPGGIAARRRRMVGNYVGDYQRGSGLPDSITARTCARKRPASSTAAAARPKLIGEPGPVS